MTYKVEEVGQNGEIAIGEELRKKLGIGPGWRAYQFLGEGCLKIYFRPPDDGKPLAGRLSKYVNESNRIGDDEWGDEFHKITEKARKQAIKEDHYKW